MTSSASKSDPLSVFNDTDWIAQQLDVAKKDYVLFGICYFLELKERSLLRKFWHWTPLERMGWGLSFKEPIFRRMAHQKPDKQCGKLLEEIEEARTTAPAPPAKRERMERMLKATKLILNEESHAIRLTVDGEEFNRWGLLSEIEEILALPEDEK